MLLRSCRKEHGTHDHLQAVRERRNAPSPPVFQSSENSKKESPIRVKERTRVNELDDSDDFANLASLIFYSRLLNEFLVRVPSSTGARLVNIVI